MLSLKYATLLAMLATAGVPATGSAISYSEPPDLSGNRLAPTALVLQVGSNLISGSTVAGDLDYLTVSIPGPLASILLAQYSTFLNSTSFIAVQSGTTFTVPATTTDPSELLGWMHFGATSVGTDVLDDIGNGLGAIGFDGPLQAGSYTFWIQELGPYDAFYRFDFVVVPEPGSAALAALALAALAALRAAS
jgi:hypothetical protein